jgi:hypothetical protein
MGDGFEEREEEIEEKPTPPFGDPIRSGRGCPFDCEFWSETQFFGVDIRVRQWGKGCKK